MKKNKNQNGITLMVLIITIILLLILTFAVIREITGDGIISHALNATSKWETASKEEENTLQDLSDYIAAKIPNKVKPGNGTLPGDSNTSKGDWTPGNEENTVTCGDVTLTIGDYVNYQYDKVSTGYSLPTNLSGYTSSQTISQTTGLKWRVLGIDANGCLVLISEKPTSSSVYFRDSVGYNNCVYLINDICKTQYSNATLGVTARSLTIEDVESGYSDIALNARNNYSNAVKYGATKTYTSNLQYPILYESEKGSGVGAETAKEGGIGGSNPKYTSREELVESSREASNYLTCTQTYYNFSSTNTGYCKNINFYQMIFGTSSSYWLASRYVDCYSSYARFGLRLVNSANLYGYDFFYSDGSSGSSNHFLRPAVSLGSDIQITKCEGDNSSSNMHQLSKIGA